MKGLRLGIIGVGMVGTPLKRWFEESGYKRNHNLFLSDIDPKKGFFDNINMAEVIFIAVPTPRNQDGGCDLSAVADALGKIVDSSSKVIVIKSTVPPGTTEYFQKKFPQWKMLFNPEFLTERQAWADFIRPDRQIVGFTGKSIDVAHLVLSLLPKAPFMSPWGLGTYKQIRITATEAEIIKYGGNVFFVRKVNFANMVRDICGTLGVDYENVRKGMGADFRIGDSHLDTSHGGYRGWGGYCFPKDLDAFISFLRNADNEEGAELLEADKDFNTALLSSQGLTVEDVSKHGVDIEALLSEKKDKN